MGGVNGALGSSLPSPLWGEGGAQRRVRGRKVTAAGVAKARALRQVPTEAEKRLWNLLRNRSVAGLKFVRQVPIDPFVADFVCRERMLVIEVDGSQHVDDEAYDRRRTAFLNARGYSVLRFWNSEVLRELAGVHELIGRVAAGESPGLSPDWRFSPATLSPEDRGDLTATARKR
ncbi:MULTISPECIES: endonuclease domain-containing protein [unclassified Devosia]|uniref:endonuclease domain-containing protein n=1 Tax=unclassified Devosia TaxID=196773 RepID=UPI001AD1830C|nr:MULTISPECIES: endonuclease domain-containing protein [unclassified Devosia]MBN9305021.1 endonuclease domain-containing protein [Devosia sp.]